MNLVSDFNALITELSNPSYTFNTELMTLKLSAIKCTDFPDMSGDCLNDKLRNVLGVDLSLIDAKIKGIDNSLLKNNYVIFRKKFYELIDKLYPKISFYPSRKDEPVIHILGVGSLNSSEYNYYRKHGHREMDHKKKIPFDEVVKQFYYLSNKQVN